MSVYYHLPGLFEFYDLYKAFLPKAWAIQRSKGIIGLLHPEGVYDDARGGDFRRLIYRRLRGHFQFINQKKLFDIGNTRPYSINLYSDEHKPNFDAIFYLFDPHTIDEAYEIKKNPRTLCGIKDENGKVVMYPRVHTVNGDQYEESEEMIRAKQTAILVLPVFQQLVGSLERIQ